MKTIAVIGSRDYSDKKYMFSILDSILFFISDFKIISGGAKGADSMAVEWAKDRNEHKPLVFLPDWNNLTHSDALIKTNKYGKKYDAKAGFRRNQQIIDNTNYCVLSFMDVYNPTNGTVSTLYMAKKAKLSAYVFYPGNSFYRVGKPNILDLSSDSIDKF